MRADRVLTIALACALALAAGACGSDAEPAGDAGPGSAATGSGEQVASGGAAAAAARPLDCSTTLSAQQMNGYAPPRAKRRYKLAFMEVSLAGYYYQALAYGAEQAAKDAGVDISIIGAKGYTDPSQQLADAENVIARGIDALVLAPVDFQGSIPIVEKATAEQIPVVNVSTEVDSDAVYKVLQDDYRQGQASAKQLVATVPDGGEGIVLGGPANATWSQQRVLGFKQELAKHPGFKIAAATNQLVDPAEGLKDFENAVQAHPDPAWIYSVFVFTLAPDSIPDRYRDVPYITTGYEPIVVSALEQGMIDSTIAVDQVAMGRIGVGAAVSALNGTEPPRVTCLPNTELSKADVGSPVANAELYPKSYKVGG